MIQHVIVPKSADAADDWIAEEVTSADIVVTADIPLAKRCLDKGALVIDHRGKTFTEEKYWDGDCDA